MRRLPDLDCRTRTGRARRRTRRSCMGPLFVRQRHFTLLDAGLAFLVFPLQLTFTQRRQRIAAAPFNVIDTGGDGKNLLALRLFLRHARGDALTLLQQLSPRRRVLACRHQGTDQQAQCRQESHGRNS
jgi:hypothetical protein